MIRKLFQAFLATAIGVCSITAAPSVYADDSSLLANGNFETATKATDWPDHWGRPAGASWETEEGNRFMRLTAAGPDKTITLYRLVDVKPDHKAYSLSFRARATDLKRGKAMWHDGRIIIDFKDNDGKKVGSGGAPNFKDTTKDGWATRNVDFLVPEGATKLEIIPAIFMAASGTFDVDDLKLTAIDPEPVKAAKEAAAQKKAEDQARRAAMVKPKVPVPSADQLPKELVVAGNQIKTVDGQAVWLQGVSLASLEWSASGDNILQSTEVAIKDWKSNVIRQPVREHFWFGTGPYQSDGGAGYRQLVDDSINLAAANGAYVVLDLHRFRAPNEAHLEFWKAIAEKYKNHPAVLFELFNEPHDISWEVWRNGGPVSDQKAVAEAKKRGEPLTENNEKLVAFQSVGMQKLIDVIREVGARNIVIAGGLDWGYDLSGILNGYALDDKGGNGIVYSSHVYPWKSDWQGKFMDLADKYPLFIGELGGEVERMSFIPADRHEDPYTWAPDMLGLIQKHKLHWTGWCFHTKSSPRLLSDWDYTPTPFWGAFVKDALNGKQFEMKKMR